MTPIAAQIQAAIQPALAALGITTWTLTAPGLPTVAVVPVAPLIPAPVVLADPPLPILPTNQTTTVYVSPTGNDAADGKTPATAKRTAPSRPASGTIILFQSGQTHSVLPIYFNGVHDVTIDAYGFGAMPDLVGVAGGNMFSWWDDSARILIKNVKCDSPWMLAQTAGGYAYHKSTTSLGNIKGTDTTIQNLYIGAFGMGFKIDGATRVYIGGCEQIDPIGMAANFVLATYGVNVTIHQNVLTGSVNEIPIRASRDATKPGNGGLQNSLIANNLVAQQLDPAHGRPAAKAGIVVRQGDHVVVANNTLANCDLSTEDDSTGVGSVTNTSLINNTITGAGKLNVRAGVVGLVVSWLTVKTTLGVAITDQAGLAGNHYSNITADCATAAIEFEVQSDATLAGVLSVRPGVPVVKGDASKLTDGGGNLVAGVACQIGN